MLVVWCGGSCGRGRDGDSDPMSYPSFAVIIAEISRCETFSPLCGLIVHVVVAVVTMVFGCVVLKSGVAIGQTHHIDQYIYDRQSIIIRIYTPLVQALHMARRRVSMINYVVFMYEICSFFCVGRDHREEQRRVLSACVESVCECLLPFGWSFRSTAVPREQPHYIQQYVLPVRT